MFIDEKLLLLQPGESRRYDEVSVKWLPDTDPSDIIVLKGGEEGESSWEVQGIAETVKQDWYPERFYMICQSNVDRAQWLR